MPTAFARLADAGVAVWLDDLSRPLILSGELADMVGDGRVIGVTTNPSIFAKSIGDGLGYEPQLQDLALRGLSAGESLRLLTAWDVRAACDILRPAYDRSAGRDGRVSIEVDPRLSRDVERTAAEACGLWWLVDRPNLLIKIPATPAGLVAFSACLAKGLSVNVTLIFSLDRYRAVLDAFMTGLEQRAAAGESLEGLESVASFFISRVDVEVDRRLTELFNIGRLDLGSLKAMRGRAASSNASLAYKIYKETAASERWKALAAKGGRLQRLLWASTGVKDNRFEATHYVTALVATDTVDTMPKATLEALAIYEGEILATGMERHAEAQALVEQLALAGVDLTETAKRLERQGIASFERSWDELTRSVEHRIGEARLSACS